MTTEEKAKAYDEALEKIRPLYEQAKKDDNPIWSTYEHLFPQLRESEDETTRNELLDFMRSFWADHKETFPQAGRWITYLEKQKEQNREDEEYTDFTIYHPLKNGKGKYECIPYSFHGSLTSFSEDKDLIDFLRTCFYTEEECNEWIKQQKEQNEITIEQVYKEFINPEKLKDAKTNKYIRAQLLWELMHNGIITAVDYQYLIDDKRKPCTEEEFLKAYKKGFDSAEQLKQKEQKEINLVNILKHYPKETELYSPLYGKLWLAEVDDANGVITCYKHPLEKNDVRATLKQEDTVSFYSNGTTGLPDFNVSEDCMLFLYDTKKQKEQKSIEDVIKNITKDKESAIKFLKSAGIMDDNGELAEMYRSEQKPIFKEGDKVIWDGEEFNILDVHKDAYNVGGYIVPFSREGELHPIGQKPTEINEYEIIKKHITEDSLSSEVNKRLKECGWYVTENKPINNGIREKIISRATSEKQVVLISESSGNAEIGWDTRSLEDAKKLLEYGLVFINKNGIKPAEKQDYSGFTDLERAIHRGFLSAGVENVPVTIIKETAQECLAQMKPAEWSEDDERIRQSVIKDIEFERNYTSAETGKVIEKYNEQIAWLKSLPLNLKKKNEDVAKLCSNEWSEEDGAKLGALINYFEGDALDYSTDDIVDWLKSLRPSWKPSEEQMKALDKAIPVCMGIAGKDKAYQLVSLYEQLKKLM